MGYQNIKRLIEAIPASQTLAVAGNQTIGGTLSVTGALAQTGTQTLGGASHAGVLMGAGTSGTPYTMTGASKSALSFYVTTADTADSNRVAYMRLYLSGAAGGGEALRAFATGSGVGLTALRGAHISANISGSGTITGEMMAVKGTLHVPNSTLGGTTSAVAAELYADGTSAAGSNVAFFRAIRTGTANNLDVAPLIAVDVAVDTGHTVQAKASLTLTGTHFLKVNIAGVGDRYIEVGTVA